MYRKYFFKNKGVLSRRFVASGLAAVFSADMFGSYAGAMELEKNIKSLLPLNEKTELTDVLNKYSVEEHDENTEKVFKACINSKSEFLTKSIKDLLWRYDDKDNNKLLENKDFLIRACAYLLLAKFYALKDKDIFSSIDDLLRKMEIMYFQISYLGVISLENYDRTNLLNKIKGGWGSKVLEKLKKEKYEQNDLKNTNINLHIESTNEYEYEQNDLKNIDINLHTESINEYESDKNKTKNKFRKTIIVVSVVIILLALIVAKTLAGKGKSNTGIPNNNKDDEKVNPTIDPENPLTGPESDDQNSQQNNQEERPSVALSNILKAAGATVTAGTLAYLFNKVSKSGKPSEVKNPKNVNGKRMSLDSDENEVKKTLESEKTHDNYDTDDKNANNSGTKQLLEDKDAEEKEGGQEEILENSALSDDTEATSDEDKNKD